MPGTSAISWVFRELFRPRRFRFSVRTLVILVTLASFLFGLYVLPAYRAQAAVEALERAGCQIRWSYQMKNGQVDDTARSSIRADLLELVGPAYFHRIVGLSCPSIDILHRKTVQEALGLHVSNLRQLTSIDFASGVANDHVLAAVGKLGHLQELSIAGPEISDRGLAPLARLSRLETLMIHAPKVTDQGVAHFKSLARLRTLDLNTTSSGFLQLPNQPAGISNLTLDRDPYPAPVKRLVEGQAIAATAEPTIGLTNESLRTIGRLRGLVSLSVLSDGISIGGLKHLVGLTRLESLQLSDRTDAPEGALMDLHSLASLRRLALFQTSMTNEEFEGLRRSNPKLNWVLARNLYFANGRVSEISHTFLPRPLVVPTIRFLEPMPFSPVGESMNER